MDALTLERVCWEGRTDEQIMADPDPAPRPMVVSLDATSPKNWEIGRIVRSSQPRLGPDPVVPGDSAVSDFEAFFTRHHRDLARLAYLVMGEHSESDDIAADALAAAWRQWDQVRASDHPVAYVRRMTINIAVTRVRGRARDRRRLIAMVPGLNQHAPSADTAAVVDVRSALLALPERRRACVVLRYAFDLSEEDVAATLGISVGTVKSQTSKAAAQLRALLGGLSPTGLTQSVTTTGDIPTSGNLATTSNVSPGSGTTTGQPASGGRPGAPGRTGAERGTGPIPGGGTP